MLLAVQDAFCFLRPNLGDAWGQAKVWAQMEPSPLTIPLPYIFLQAMVIVAIGWGWRNYSRYLFHRFFGVHGGIEFHPLRRCDVVHPSRLVPKSSGRLYSRVRRPKNAWKGPRIQHSCINISSVVSYLTEGLPGLASGDCVYAYSFGLVRSRRDAILRALGLERPRLTPRNLRGGGTVWMYEATECVAKVQWIGRWQRQEILEFYLQEALVHSRLDKIRTSEGDRPVALAEVFSVIFGVWFFFISPVFSSVCLHVCGMLPSCTASCELAHAGAALSVCFDGRCRLSGGDPPPTPPPSLSEGGSRECCACCFRRACGVFRSGRRVVFLFLSMFSEGETVSSCVRLCL